MDTIIQYEIIQKFVNMITSPALKDKVEHFTKDLDSAYYKTPAGRKCHGFFPGGLATHCANMCLILDSYCKLSCVSKVDTELVIAGILLHDVGKIDAYKTLEDGKVVNTVLGELYGHLQLSYDKIRDLSCFNSYDDESKLEPLLHIIASHHGKREWGAIQQPKTAEAVLVHQLDMLESRMSGLVGVAHGDRPAVLDGASFFNFAEVDLGAD